MLDTHISGCFHVSSSMGRSNGDVQYVHDVSIALDAVPRDIVSANSSITSYLRYCSLRNAVLKRCK